MKCQTKELLLYTKLCLVNRPHTDVLAENNECCVGITDSREQVSLFRLSKFCCSSDEIKATLQ